MESVAVAFISKTHSVVINLIALLIGAAILVWVWSAITVLKKNITVHATADSILSLQKEYNELNNRFNSLWGKNSQARAVLTGIKNVYSELKYLLYLFVDYQDIQAEANSLFKLITDRLASDLKYYAGELRRCAIWFPVDDSRLVCMLQVQVFRIVIEEAGPWK